MRLWTRSLRGMRRALPRKTSWEVREVTLDQARVVCAELIAEGTYDNTDQAANELLLRDEIEIEVYVELISREAWERVMVVA